MPSLSFILQKLKALRCNSERKNFLLWYLKEFKPKKGTIRLIVDLMFYQDYDDNWVYFLSLFYADFSTDNLNTQKVVKLNLLRMICLLIFLYLKLIESARNAAKI